MPNATALLDGAAIVTDPAGLWALIEEYAEPQPRWQSKDHYHRDQVPIAEQIRAALGLSEGGE